MYKIFNAWWVLLAINNEQRPKKLYNLLPGCGFQDGLIISSIILILSSE